MSNKIDFMKLQDIVTFSQGIQVPVEEQFEKQKDNHVRFLRIVDYTRGDVEPRYIDDRGSKYAVQSNDVIMIRYGEAGRVVRGYEGVIANNLFKITPNNDCIDKDFLYYLLTSDTMYKKIANTTQTTGMPAVNFKNLYRLEISLPQLKEQKKIAEILSSVDAAIEKTEQVIAKTEEVKKGLMQQLLTKGISHTEYKNSELGEIPLKWEIKQLKDLLEIKYGKDQKQVICEDGKYNILGTGGIIGKTNSYLYDKPSVLIGRKGTIDNPMYIEEPFWTVDTLFYTVINPNNFEKWIYYAINNINLMKYNEATGVPSLSVNNLNTIKFAVPPYDEQVKIVNVLDSTEQKIQSENLKLNRLMILKQGLMQKLLTGQVRVKVD